MPMAMQAGLWGLLSGSALVRGALYRAFQFQATGRNKTKPVRRRSASAADLPNASFYSFFQDVRRRNRGSGSNRTESSFERDAPA